MFTLLVILLALAFDILVYLTAGSFLAVESFEIQSFRSDSLRIVL